MQDERYAHPEQKEAPPQESYISTTVLNALIYEYLVKKNYTGSAKVFKVEGDVTGINITQGSSALLDWFVAFNDLYNVRSGRSKPTSIVGKIDAILGRPPGEEERSELQERRYSAPSWYDAKNPAPTPREPRYAPLPPREREGDLLNKILEIDEAEYPAAPFSPRLPRLPREKDSGSTAVLKEIKKLKLHTQKINTMSICHRRKILVTGGVDASICVVDLTNINDIVKFESHTMQISQVKVKDVVDASGDTSVYFGSASLDRDAKVYKVVKNEGKLEVSAFLYLKGHKSSVKGIDFTQSKIYTMGIDGELRVWNMEGACLGAFALRKTVKLLAARADNMIALCDVNSVSLFNPETAAYSKELSGKGASSLYKTQTNMLFVLSDSVLIYDRTFCSPQVLQLPSDKIHSSCIIAGRLFLGGYQMVYEVCEKSVQVFQVHEGVVNVLEGTVLNNRVVLLTGSNEGEVKVWETAERIRN